MVAHVLQAQWRRRAATRFVVAVRRQQENTAQDTPSILLEDAEMCHVRLVARAGAARAVQRSWRRACQVARLGQARLVALGLQAQWRRRAATRMVALLRLWRRAATRIVASLRLEDAERRRVRPWARKYFAGPGTAAPAVVPDWRAAYAHSQAQQQYAARQAAAAQARQAVEAQAMAQAQVQAQADNNYKYKTRTRNAELQNKTYNPLSSSSRPRSLLSSTSGASSHLPSPSTIVVKVPTFGET